MLRAFYFILSYTALFLLAVVWFCIMVISFLFFEQFLDPEDDFGHGLFMAVYIVAGLLVILGHALKFSDSIERDAPPLEADKDVRDK